MTYSDMKNKLNGYNWDGGFTLPKEILDDPNCDLALALEIFYLADGVCYLENQSYNPNLEKWSLFIAALYNDILNGKYPKTDTLFEVPLSNVAKYKLRKIQVPEVFLTDL